MTFTHRDAVRLYGIDGWGSGYFDVNAKGHLVVKPSRSDAATVDLMTLVPKLKEKEARFPVLVRFPQILEDRVKEIFTAFNEAIDEYKYAGAYRGVFPIKVNQQKEVLDPLVAAGAPLGMGLEAGSKAELTIALSRELRDDAVIICNGYKDAAYVRLALQGIALGRKVILIVEKAQEVPLIIRVSQEMSVAPMVGVRIRLRAAAASGRSRAAPRPSSASPRKSSSTPSTSSSAPA
jgi:arginine decarboxylase